MVRHSASYSFFTQFRLHLLSIYRSGLVEGPDCLVRLFPLCFLLSLLRSLMLSETPFSPPLRLRCTVELPFTNPPEIFQPLCHAQYSPVYPPPFTTSPVRLLDCGNTLWWIAFLSGLVERPLAKLSPSSGPRDPQLLPATREPLMQAARNEVHVDSAHRSGLPIQFNFPRS